MPDFYIPGSAVPVKNKDLTVAPVLCDTKVKNCLLSNFIEVKEVIKSFLLTNFEECLLIFAGLMTVFVKF